MGRRSRKRVGAATVPRVETPASPPRPARTSTPLPHARLDEAPKAPWHPFPLVELSILVGLVLVIAGFVIGGGGRPVLIFGGLALVSVATLELAIREHFAGYRSHSALLAALTAVGIAIPLWWTPVPQEAILAIAVIVGVVAFRALRAQFARKAGGLTWRA